MSSVESNVVDIIESFLTQITSQSRLSPRELERVLAGEKTDLKSSDLGQKPETFTQNKLIFPLLRTMGVEFEEQPHGQTGARQRWPDFGSENLKEYVIGESKPLNHAEEGRGQIKEYLDSISIGSKYGIVTDGISWEIYSVERGGDVTEFPRIKSVDLRPLILQVARDNGHIQTESIEDVDIHGEAREFIEVFSTDNLNELVSVTAPKFLRERRKRDVEEFYDLYIELLFGEGDDFDYDTHLMNDIVAPTGATDTERRRFAVTLMNRLLFVKILETKGVLEEGLLEQRLDQYEDHQDAFMNNFYDSQLKPLFYSLLNTPVNDRLRSYTQSWMQEVPYLNGGLFRENVSKEDRYTVNDRVLTEIIHDLIEGSRLGEDGGELDPAILGSVFEMTINFMGGEFGSQQDLGAYYTPDDVTQLITSQSVNPRVKEILVDTWSTLFDEHEGAVRQYLDSLEMAEVLEMIEGRNETALVIDDTQLRIEFGDDEQIQEAIERVTSFTILDPACGSGHFLTTAMEQLYRVREVLERGLNGGEGLDEIAAYEAKKELALNNVYGVDVDPVGIEIARLRIWLKIIEDGWKEEYGRLPNIELNVVSGNSLVGLPVEQQDQMRVDIWDERLENLIDLRLEYKQTDNVDKETVLEKRDEIRRSMDDEFLKRLDYEYETEVESLQEWEQITESLANASLHSEIASVQVKRSDGEGLSDDDITLLDEKGFRTFSKSARLRIEKRSEQLDPEKATRSKDSIAQEILSDLTEIISTDRFYFAEVVRKPLKCDLDNILGTPFHWVAEFPELAYKDDYGQQTVGFDIIVGNPPYGDLLNESASMLTEWYETAGNNDISFRFIERQLQLLKNDGYYGNITSLRFVYQNDAYPVHDYMREALENIKIACFSHRPEPIFENATVRTAIVSGKKNIDIQSEIRTSEMMMLDADSREEKLKNITYASVEDFLLRDKIGSEERNGYEILPKVGGHTNLLGKIKDHSGRILEDVRAEDGTDYPNYRKRGGGYWLGFAPKNEWGDLTSIEPIYYKSELHRDAAFLLVNSNLYYLFYLTYSNFRNFDFGHIDKFPFPFKSDEELEEYEAEISEYKERLWQAHLDHPGKKSDERFDMSGVKSVINEIERELISEWFDLDENDVEYLNSYHQEFGRSLK